MSKVGPESAERFFPQEPVAFMSELSRLLREDYVKNARAIREWTRSNISSEAKQQKIDKLEQSLASNSHSPESRRQTIEAWIAEIKDGAAGDR